MAQPCKIHWSFWLAGTFALVWNSMGVMNFLMQMNADALGDYPQAARAIVDGRPAWATAGFAISVVAGALGGTLLLLKKSSAIYLFVLSLAGTVLTMIHTVSVVGPENQFGAVQISMFLIMPLLVAALFAGYARWAATKNWIR